MIDVILSQLLVNEPYFQKVWPHLKPEYFDAGPPKIVFKIISAYVNKYGSVPSKTALKTVLDKCSITESELKESKSLIDSLSSDKENAEWCVDETEKYVQQTAIYNATSRIIEIQTNAELPPEKQDKRLPSVGAIPEIMKEAISISFDDSIGHDWIDDYEQRWLVYQTKSHKIPFGIDILNKITKGGVENATLNVILAGVNVGKSLGLCSLAADYMKQGKNVLYISMEMSEFMCAKRIDANLLDVTLDDLDDNRVSYAEYKQKMERYKKSGTLGQLKIKQYGTGAANAHSFDALLNELKLKSNFKPDVIIVDYLGICSSVRMRAYSENSYTMVKAIAEELRALSFKHNVPIWSAAQTTRGAWDSSDVQMSDVAESAGLPATVDFMIAVIETEELAQQGRQLVKQIKSRYGDKNINNKFMIGVKKGNQRWYELDVDKQLPESNARKSTADKTNRAKLDELAEEFS